MSDFYERYKKQNEKINAAFEAEEKRTKKKLQSTYDEIINDINTEIDTFKKLSTPSWGGGTEAFKANVESTRQSRVNIGKLTRKVEAYRKFFGDETADALLKSLNSMSDTYDTHLKLAEGRSQYASEEEFETLNGLYSMSSDDIKMNMARDIADKDAQKATLQKEWDTLNSKIVRYGRGDKSAFKNAKEYNEAKKRKNELSKQINQTPSGIAYTTSSGQNITWQSLYDQKKYEEDFEARYNEASSAEDWKKGIDYALNLKNPTPNEANGWISVGGKDIGGEEIKNKLTYAKEHETEIQMARANGSHVGDIYLYLQMNDKEAELYNYYLYAGGEKKADEYFNSIKDTLKRRDEGWQLEGMQRVAEEMPVFASAASVLTSLGSGLEYVGDAVKFVATGELDRNQLAEATNVTRQTVAEKVDWEIGNWDAFDFVYNTGMSMIDSSVAMTTFGGLGGVALGMSAAAQGTNDALDRGMSKGQAFMSGLASGVFEGLFESWSIGAFGDLTKNLKRVDFQNIAKYIGKNMWNNAKEEFLTELANVSYDYMVNGDFSQIETSIRQYMSMGLSESEAKKKVATELGVQLAEAAGSGALMGFGFGGYGATSNAINAAQTGKAIKNKGQVGNLVELGKSLGEGTDSYELAQKVTDKPTALAIGSLLGVAEDDIMAANRGDIVKSLERKGYDTEKANEIADSLLDPESKQGFSPDSAEGQAYKNIVANPKSTLNQRTQPYIDILDNLENGNAKKAIVSTDDDEDASQGISAPAETNSASATESVAKSKYEVSADGKTINTKSGEIVNVQKIESISENGEANLTTDDGMVVKASDLSFGSDAEALFVENIGAMKIGKNPISTNSANLLYMTAMGELKNNPNMSADKAMSLIKGLGESFVYGAYNFDKTRLTNSEAVAFANELTEEQRKYAYELGTKDAVSKAEADQKVIDELKEKAKPKATKKSFGKVIFEKGAEVDESTLTKTQKANLNGIKLLAEISSVEFHVFRSDKNHGFKYTMPNGTVTTANGWYVAGTNQIWIDLNAGNSGEGTMIRTAAHEISHYIKQWSPQKWKAMADLLMAEFAKNDVNTESLLNRQIAKIKRRYTKQNMPSEAVIKDMAYEELVSDALSDMLTDGSIVNFIAEVKAKDKNLGQKILDAIKSLLKKWGLIIDDYKGRELDTDEAQALSQFEDTFKKLQEMYQEAFVDANETVATIGARNLADFAEAKNTEGESLFQYRAMEADESTYRDMLKKWGKMSDTQINNLFATIDKAMDIIKDNLEVLDYAWESDIDDRAFSPVKPNSDSLYQVSLDFSTLCRKRILQQTIQAHLQEALNQPLTREEGIAIRDALMALQEEGRQIEVACALCYVESARMKSPAQIKKFLNNREAVIKDFFAGKSGGSMKSNLKQAEADAREKLHKENPNGINGKDGETMLDPRTAPLKAMPKKYAETIRDAKKAAKESYKPTAEEQKLIDVANSMNVSDFTSPEGLENLAKNYPALFDAYTSYIRIATKSKGIEGDTWWRAGDSQKIGDVLIANMNRENGLRSQSWSDFQVIHILDYIAATIELSTRNAKEQAYSKVPDYIELMGQTGVMLNMSLIPTRHFNGSLEYDSVEGMDYKRALELREKYPATAGTICIGVDNKQIQMLLADATIDYVIPYHKSGMAASIRKLMHIPTWSQYEDFQSEKNLSRKEAEAQAKKYGVKLLAESDPNYHKHTAFSEWFDLEVAKQISKMENANPSNKAMQKKYGVMYGGYMAMQNAANNYLKLCAERGIAPKFSHESADFTAEDNYWKLLIDRKMVNNATGEIIEQQTIKPIFDEGEVLRILNDELERYPSVKADQEYATRKVTEKFLSGEIKSGMSAEAIAKVMKTPVDNIATTNIHSSLSEFNKSRRLTELDLSDYLKAGTRLNKAKQQALNEGKKIILVTEDEITDYISASIKGEKSLTTVAYGRVTDRLAADVAEYSQGDIIIDDNFLELVSYDIDHAYREHLKAKEEGDIDLRDEDFENIPEYIDNYDELVYAIRYKSGNTRICLSKKLANGRVLLIETVSKSRGSVEFKNMIGVSNEKYVNEYEKVYKKGNSSNTRGSKSSNISLHDETVSEDSITDSSDSVNMYSDRDSDYMDAVNNNDMETAQRMVDEAAYNSGLRYVGLHGTNRFGLTEFDRNKNHLRGAHYFTTKYRVAESYSGAKGITKISSGADRGNYEVALDIKNPLVIDCKGNLWNDIPFDIGVNRKVATYDIVTYAEQHNYDGVIFKNVIDAGQNLSTDDEFDILYSEDGKKKWASTVFAVFNSNQIKSLDPVTYDNKGKVIPLSERFNESNKDIRYSERDLAPTFYSQMGKVVEGVKQEKLAANSVVNMLRGKGVKAEEIRWSGIVPFLEGKKSVTKQELLNFINGSMLQIGEQMSSNDIDLRYDTPSNSYTLYDANGKAVDTYTYNEFMGGYVSDATEEIYSNSVELEDALREEYGSMSSPRWSEYKLDGGTNYRELVFTMPNSTYTNRAMKAHWGQDAEGVLVHTRVQDFEVNGKKMLFIEELQSDWHNEGHSKGYSTKEYEDAVESQDKLYNKYKKLDLAFHKYVRSNEFMTDPEDVRKKKHKWLLEKAETAHKKYLDAEKAVNSLKEKGAGDTPDAPFKENYHEFVLKRLLRMAAEQGYDSIGWTPADIQSERWSEDYAEGYRIEYDQDMPKFLRKYGRQWGATVGKTSIAAEDSMKDSKIESRALEILSEKGIVQFHWNWSHEYGLAYEQAKKELSQQEASVEVWSMDITDSMRESVLYEGQVMYSERVMDENTLDFLENQEHVTVYRAMQLIDEKLYPPMNAYTYNENGKKVLITPSEIGVWEQAVERPDLIDPKTGKFKLDKGKVDSGKRGTPVNAAYNPYIHTSLSMLNDQFTSAYTRSNLVVVKGIVPKSELTSGYHAQYAKDSVGETEWHSGVVSTQLPESRKVILSRWFKPVEVMDNDVVAENIKDMLGNTGIEIPYNVVSPKLRRSLEKIGVPIGEGRGIKNLPKKDEVLYSERDSSTSNRSILANSLESAAKNDIEKNKLAEYKEKISLIESEEQRLTEIREQLFTKGAVEPSQRKDLQFEAKQIANRINTYDRQLLTLEATSALKNVLNREKALAAKRQKQKDAEAMREYKEKVAKNTRELLDRNRDSRKKAIESRNRTAMRHKIQSVVGDLNSLLLKPTKERHVPEEMRIAVSEALSIVNMDTVDADTRVAKYNDLIAKAKDPDVIASLTESRDRILEQGNKLSEKLTKLKDAYGMVRDSADDSLRSMYDDVIYNKIESVQQKVGKTPLRNMTLEQLESVYELYKMVLTTVRDSNKAFAENLKMSRLALGSNTFAEIKENNKARDSIKHETMEKFLWQNLKPMQAMKTIGSGTLQKLWNNILYGQETFAQDYYEAVEFAKGMKEKYGYKKWNLEKLYSFESKSGKTMKLNLEQMMSIYAYSKRAQADEHIEYGGIVLNEGVIKVKNKLGKTVEVNVNDSTAYRLDKMQVAKIVSTLKKEFPGAKDFVDEMQKYLSETMGAKGNEVSMKMYGINLFKEEHYFPLKSSKDFMEAANAKLKGDVKIKNKGMTKSTVEHARNPIVLESFLDVWGNHINEMALYHGLVLPLEDFSRTLNYSFKADDNLNTDAESVRTALHDAFGDNADNYLNELLKAINGGVLHDSSAQFADKMISKFKKAKVMASLSVVVQQPTAIVRAMGIIEPKYFVAQNFRHKQTWEELKKYCPTAIIKETGSFDTNMGRTIVDMVKDDRGFTDKVGDFLGKAPAYMDEVGWNMIWRALKNKVATEQKLSGEALLQECGKQMTIIINETQVYDSVLARNELMRSKSTFTKMATSFMAEPSTVANMIYGAALDFKRGNKGLAGKTVSATIASVVINGLVSALVYAARDDDEDETFLEKYLSSATTEVLDGLNPLTYIPFVKDVYSLFQGYKVERTDMALIKDVVEAIDSFYNVLDPEAYEDMSKGEILKHIYENSAPLLTSICDMFGLPVGNILRDAKAVFFNDNVPMSQSSSAGTGYAFKEGAMGVLPKFVQKIIGTDSKQDKLYDAIMSGDTTYIERLKSGYKDDKAYETAVRSALRENDSRIREAAEARINGDIAEYSRIVKEIKAEGFFSQDTIVASVNAEINAINKGESTSSESANEDKVSSIYKMDDYYASIVGGDQATAYVVKEDIINTDVENGKDRDEAEDSFNSRFSSYVREQYEDGYITEREAERMLVNYGDKSEDAATAKVQYWTFKQKYPDYDDLSEEAVTKYYVDVEPYGINIDVYYDYSKQKSKCKGTDRDGDGKTDSGSKKAEILRVIDSLPINRSQKDVLYYLNGWSSKTIYEAPWH